jgi:hypothetical protein
MLTETTTTSQDPGAEPKPRVWIDPPQSVEQLMLAALLRIEKLLTPKPPITAGPSAFTHEDAGTGFGGEAAGHELQGRKRGRNKG